MTKCRASTRFIDDTALQDATMLSSGRTDFSNLKLFKEKTSQAPYATLELNQFVLDGSRKIMSSDCSDVAFWSNVWSSYGCEFMSVPLVSINFTGPHTTHGITLFFEDDYPVKIGVRYLGKNRNILKEYVFYPDSLIYKCYGVASDYYGINIFFETTRFPKRYIKLQYIMYGVDLEFDENIIKTANVHEEIDETGNTLPINTATLEIIDENEDYNIGNENGSWKTIQKTQEFTFIEEKDNEEINIGSFFVDDFSYNANITTLKFVDWIGLFDKQKFSDSEMYINRPAGEIIKEIFTAANYNKEPIISDELYNVPITGYIPICSCRDALRIVCFAINAVADDSRSDSIRIFSPDRYISSYIGTDRKFNGKSRVTLGEYINGVSFKIPNYVQENVRNDAFSGFLEAGEHTIEFGNPYVEDSIETDFGEIIKSKTNYCVISLSEDAEVHITGIQYKVLESKYIKKQDVAFGETENIKEYEKITLYNRNLLSEKADFLLKYFSLRKMLSMEYILEKESVGTWSSVEDISGNGSSTLIESQDIDLSGGFIASATCRGYSRILTELCYTGNELYAGAISLI